MTRIARQYAATMVVQAVVIAWLAGRSLPAVHDGGASSAEIAKQASEGRPMDEETKQELKEKVPAIWNVILMLSDYVGNNTENPDLERITDGGDIEFIVEGKYGTASFLFRYNKHSDVQPMDKKTKQEIQENFPAIWNIILTLAIYVGNSEEDPDVEMTVNGDDVEYFVDGNLGAVSLLFEHNKKAIQSRKTN